VTPGDNARWSALRHALEGQPVPPSFPVDDRVLLMAKQRVALAAKVRNPEAVLFCLLALLRHCSGCALLAMCICNAIDAQHNTICPVCSAVKADV
jgi:hypothetical protein